MKIIDNNWHRYTSYVIFLCPRCTNRRNFTSYKKDLVGRRLIKEAIIKSEWRDTHIWFGSKSLLIILHISYSSLCSLKKLFPSTPWYFLRLLVVMPWIYSHLSFYIWRFPHSTTFLWGNLFDLFIIYIEGFKFSCYSVPNPQGKSVGL